VDELFNRIAKQTSRATGRPIAFVLAFGVILVWALSGPIFGFSDTWQLVINTSTTIATFLMVFLIQNTQNRDSAAIHLKLDELIRSNKQAHNSLLDLEQGDEEILGKLRERYGALAEKARNEVGAQEVPEDEGAAGEDGAQAAGQAR
jgi:low affinity Fe/Cu permease